MMQDYWVNPAIFLIETLFGLYIFALLMRFLFQWTGADYQNPISQMLIRMTHPVLKWTRKVIPSIGRLDTASVVLILGLQVLSDDLIFLLKGSTPSIAAVLVWSLGQLMELILNIFLFAVLARALMSWLGPQAAYNPVASLLFSLTEPLLRLCRRMMPQTGGIDFSPLIPLIAIQLAKMLFLPPLQQLSALLY